MASKVDTTSSIALFQLYKIIQSSNQDVLINHFFPDIIGELSISEHLRQLIALPKRLGGMAVATPHLNTEAEYHGSRLPTKDIVDHIISQNTEYISPRD